MEPKIVTLDIERQSAIVDGVWELRQRGYLSPRQIIVPVRTICFAWKWLHEDEFNFSAEWDPYDNGQIVEPREYKNTGLLEDYHIGHRLMMENARAVLHEADFVIGWNSKPFDIKNLKVHIAEWDIDVPSPHTDVDLIKTSRSEFGFMSHKLEEAAAHFGIEGKLDTGSRLWPKLRWSKGDELEAARKLMREYNIHDVDITEQVYYKMRPWIPRLNLYGNPEASAEMGGDAICRVCKSYDIIWQGIRRYPTYWYKRFQCKRCRHWGKTTKSFYAMETSSI